VKERFVVIIPARYASTRLPGKPLRKIAGLPMILHTVARSRDSGAAVVYVATDDERIRDACAGADVKVVMTRDDHQSGSDRLAEVCDALHLDDNLVVVNVQGDEPLIEPAVIEQVATLLMDNADCEMASLYDPVSDRDEVFDPDVVKVVCDARGRALYFSRAPIPFDRERYRGHAPIGAASSATLALRHIGLYAYRAGFLRRFVDLAPAPLERMEALEQLRALHHGARIMMAQACARSGPGVDTQQDLQRVESLLQPTPSGHG
jgi:3-deoxy-manno-octulosonate cytidylyltransferase (CMP-KDO synthetase)